MPLHDIARRQSILIGPKNRVAVGRPQTNAIDTSGSCNSGASNRLRRNGVNSPNQSNLLPLLLPGERMSTNVRFAEMFFFL